MNMDGKVNNSDKVLPILGGHEEASKSKKKKYIIIAVVAAVVILAVVLGLTLGGKDDGPTPAPPVPPGGSGYNPYSVEAVKIDGRDNEVSGTIKADADKVV